jgi:hypothetical protein
MTETGEVAGEPVVVLKTWITVGGALIGAFMAVLNIQITNASLPYIEGGIGTGGVYGTWISTAYLIGEIIVIPLTDFLSRVFSLRRYLLANVALFLLFSALCGQASSLTEMIVLRALQGFAGGVMIPLAFTIIMTMLPRSKHANRASRLLSDCDLRAGDRSDHRRLFHRQLWLALDFLHQSGPRRGHARSTLVRPAEVGDAVRFVTRGRLAGYRADGCWPRRLSNGARRRQCV